MPGARERRGSSTIWPPARKATERVLLAIDVGNTQIVVGLFADNDGVGTGELVHHWRVATHPQYTADEFALQLSQLLALDGLDFSSVTGTVVACVVPPVQAALRQMTARRLSVPTVIVEPGVRTGMPVLVDNPKEVGADRIADAVAAFERYGGPTIVVDFGTATNFEVISAKGEYLGGVLFPWGGAVAQRPDGQGGAASPGRHGPAP